MSSLPKTVRLAVSPLSWANDVLEDLGADIPLDTCLKDAAAIGYDGVELGRKFPRDGATLAPLLSTHGLSLASGWHSGSLAEGTVATELNAVRGHAALLAEMGCDVMVYGETAMMTEGAPLDAPMSQRRIMPKADVAGYTARLTEFGAGLWDNFGLKLAYHHHLMMVAETFDEISALFDRTGPACGLLLDTGHAAGAGFDYNKLIDRFGDRIVHIHLKDIRADRMGEAHAMDQSFNTGVRGGMFTVPGDGALDFAPIAAFVRNTGYRGWLVVEAEQDPELAPPRAATTRAFAHIQHIFSDHNAGSVT